MQNSKEEKIREMNELKAKRFGCTKSTLVHLHFCLFIMETRGVYKVEITTLEKQFSSIHIVPTVLSS